MLHGVASRTLAGKGELERRGSAGALCEGEVHLARTTERTLGEWVDLSRRRGPWARGRKQGAGAELQRGKIMQMLKAFLS